MPMKIAKQIRPSDRIRLAVSNGHKCYTSWCKVKKVTPIKIWKNPILNTHHTPDKSHSDELLYFEYEVDSGLLRGEVYHHLAFKNDTLMTPNRPWKIIRIWRALIS